ncbi:hypothetical protein SAY87_003256 [Trapa incisa]|uniref:Uncharacterized protein n=1 Tax=Trapa incisa TaxID=236973 RepID=A0AAN7KR39_9MYRT|nr:hypothetical protein SAY87_003256 [Trapa incisa]
MAERGKFLLYAVLATLAFAELLRSSSAVPVTREGRLDIEINDYPGSGANNRHNPRPQLGRGCIDC